MLGDNGWLSAPGATPTSFHFIGRARGSHAKKDAVIAVFDDHQSAETAVKNLASAGFDMKSLTIVGKAYHVDEKVR